MSKDRNIPGVSVTYAQNGSSTHSNELSMRAMQERAYEKCGEQYLLIKSPPASSKSRRFRNDTERLEKLFAMYTKMTTTPAGLKDQRAAP
jgi:hypothetical protein